MGERFLQGWKIDRSTALLVKNTEAEGVVLDADGIVVWTDPEEPVDTMVRDMLYRRSFGVVDEDRPPEDDGVSLSSWALECLEDDEDVEDD
jgi:hypothetical protein